MEHQDQDTEQKVLPVTDTSTVQSLIENTQDDIVVVDDNLQDNNRTPRQSSFSHIQNPNSSRSNSPPRNSSINNHLPNQSPEPNGSQNNVHNTQVDEPRFIDGSNGPCQTINVTPGSSPATSFSNEHSFNTTNIENSGPDNTTNIENSGHINNYFNFHGDVNLCGRTIFGQDDTHDHGRGTNINQHELSPPLPYYAGKVSTSSTTRTNLALPQNLNTPIATSDLDTLRKPVQATSPSPSTSTTHHESSLVPISSLHSGQEYRNLGDTSITSTGVPVVDAPSVTAGALEEQDTSIQVTTPKDYTTPEHDHAISQLHPLLRAPLPHMEPNGKLAKVTVGHFDTKRRRVGTVFIDSVNQLKHSAKSIKSSFKSGTQSLTSSKPFSSITHLSTRSKVSTLLSFVEQVPVVAAQGKKKKFPKEIEVYIHAEVDPFPGIEPFRPLRDPNMTHQRSTDVSDGSLHPVYGVNVYDVGYFNPAGQFILLFNLQKTKEENEKLLNFQFKTTSFVPLTGGFVRSSPLNKQIFQVWNDGNIVPDGIYSEYDHELKSREYMCRFIVKSPIKNGTAIAMMGQVRQYMDSMSVVNTQWDYFAKQSIEWYRHAKGERDHNIENGDLVLITQCYKVPSWGYINYYSKVGTTKNTWAAFQQGMTGKGLYGWIYESPQLDGLEGKQHQSTLMDPTAGPPDQCIGVRSYSIHCDPQAWKSICKELKSRRTPKP